MGSIFSTLILLRIGLKLILQELSTMVWLRDRIGSLQALFNGFENGIMGWFLMMKKFLLRQNSNFCLEIGKILKMLEVWGGQQN